MIVLLVLIIFGALMAFFANLNNTPVDLNVFGVFFTGVPLYLVVLGSAGIGIFLAWILSLVGNISSVFTMFRKDRQIAETSRTAEDLQQRVHALEVENTKLRAENDTPVVVKTSPSVV